MPQHPETGQDTSKFTAEDWYEHYNRLLGGSDLDNFLISDSISVAEPQDTSGSGFIEDTTPEIIVKDSNETNLSDEDENDEKLEDFIHGVVTSPKDGKEEQVSADSTKGRKNIVSVQRNNVTAENLLTDAMSGKDVGDKLSSLINLAIRDGEEIVEGIAYGPFQLHDGFSEDDAQAVHNKPLSELTRMEQYDVARYISSREGWARWNAYSNGSYSKFMPNGSNHVTDEMLMKDYNVPEGEVEHLKKTFGDEWDVAKAVMVAESGTELVKGSDNFIKLDVAKVEFNKNKIAEHVLELTPLQYTAQNGINPFERKLQNTTYFDEDGRLVQIPNDSKMSMEQQMQMRLNDPDGFKNTQIEGMKNLTEEEQRIFLAAKDWVDSGDFDKWWGSKSDFDKALFEGVVEHSLTYSLGFPMHKYLFDEAMFITGTERSFMEKALSPAIGFMMPLDIVGFSGFSRLGGYVLKKPMQHLFSSYVTRGYSTRLASQGVQKHWLNLAVQANSMGFGIGLYNTSSVLNEMLQASGIQSNEFSSHRLLMEMGKGWGLGASTAVMGRWAGKAMGAIGDRVRGGPMIGAEQAKSVTVGQFLGETATFTIGGSLASNPEKWINPEGLTDLWNSELHGMESFAETATFLLTMKAFHGITRNGYRARDIKKWTEADQLLKTHTLEEIELKIRTKAEEKLAEQDGETINDTKDNLTQLRLFPESEVGYSIKIKNQSIKEAVIEVATEMGLQLDLPLYEIYNEVKKSVETGGITNKVGKQLELDMADPIQNSPEGKDATGLHVNLSKKRRRDALKDKIKIKKTAEDIKEPAELREIDVGKAEPPNEKLMKAVRGGNIDNIVETINEITFLKNGKPVSQSQKPYYINKKVGEIIKDVKKIRDTNRELKGVGEAEAIKAMEAMGEKSEAAANIRKARKLEDRVFNQLENLIKQTYKVNKKGESTPNIKGINVSRENIIKANDALAELNVNGYGPIEINFGFAGGIKSANPEKAVQAFKKTNQNVDSIIVKDAKKGIPQPVRQMEVLHTTVEEDKKFWWVKTKKSRDKRIENEAPNMKVHKSFKTEAGARKEANDILGDNYVGEWKQHLIQYWEGADGRWNYRVLKGPLKPYSERSGGYERWERPTLMDRNRADARIETEYGSSPEGSMPDKIRDPRLRRDSSIKIEMLDHNLRVLDAQVASINSDIASVKRIKRKIHEIEPDPVIARQKLIILNNDLDKLKYSLNATHSAKKKDMRSLKHLMTTKELIDETTKRAVGLGSFGYIDWSVWKDMSKDIKGSAYQLTGLLKALWTKAPYTAKMKKKEFIKWITEQGLKDKEVLKFLEKGKNYKHFKETAELENLLEVNEIINNVDMGEGGPPKHTRSPKRTGDYVGAMAFTNVKDAGHYSVLKAFYMNLGGEFEKSVRGTTTLPKIKMNSRKAENQRIVADYVLGGEIIEKDGQRTWQNKHASAMDWSSIQQLLMDNLHTSADMFLRNPKNKHVQDLFVKHALAEYRLRSEWGRTGRVIREGGESRKEVFEKVRQIMEKTGPIEGDPKGREAQDIYVGALYDILNKYDIKDIAKNPKIMWKLAEMKRNVLLFGTSYSKSLYGNTTATALEALTHLASPITSFIWDPARKYSGITAKQSLKSSGQQFMTSFGPINLVNPSLKVAEMRAKALGTHSTLYQSYFGENGALKTAGNIMLENSEFMNENPLLFNEGWSRHIGGRTVGEFYEQAGWSTKGMPENVKNFSIFGGTVRTFQNLHGALDAQWRIPNTNIRLYELANRTAVKELKSSGKKYNGEDILKRTEEILQDKDASALLMENAKEYGAYTVFQERFQSDMFRKFNALRTDQDSNFGGFMNWMNPFVVTYMNVFKKFGEYSPAGMIMWKGRDAWARSGFLNEARANRHYFSPRISPDRDLLAEVSARSLVGTTVTYVLGQLLFQMDQGKLVGDTSHLTTENRDVLSAMGKQSNSITLGDKNYALSGVIEPLGLNFQAFVEFINAPDDPLARSRWSVALRRWTQSIVNNPIATNFVDIQKVFEGKKSVEWYAVKQISSQIVPTALKQLYGMEQGVLKRSSKVDTSTEGAFDTFFEALNHTYGNFSNLDASTLFEAIKAESAPLGWALGFGGEIDKRYAVVDLFGNVVRKASDKARSMMGVRALDIKSGKVEDEYERLFMSTQEPETLRYQTGVIGDGASSITLTNDELYMVHLAQGKSFREQMDILMDTEGYRELASQTIAKPITLEEMRGVFKDYSPQELEEVSQKREAESYSALDDLRDMWRTQHLLVKEATRQYYLGDVYNLGAIKEAFTALGRQATKLTYWNRHSRDPEFRENMLEFRGMLREAVFERDDNGEYTKYAEVAQQDVIEAFRLLNSRRDAYGYKEQKAENILRKYAFNIDNENFAVNRRAVEEMVEEMHGYIYYETDQFGRQLEFLLKNVEERKKSMEKMNEDDLKKYKSNLRKRSGVPIQ